MPKKHGSYENDVFWTMDDDYKSFMWHGRNESGFKTLLAATFANQPLLNHAIESDATDLF